MQNRGSVKQTLENEYQPVVLGDLALNERGDIVVMHRVRGERDVPRRFVGAPVAV